MVPSIHLACHLCQAASPESVWAAHSHAVTFPFCQGPPFWSKALCTCGRRPQLEALLQPCRSVVLWQGLLEGLLTPPPFPASQLHLELLLAWRLPGRAQAAITWERKHLTFEAATQYHLLCGGGRGRRLAINSLLRANSSSVLRNQIVLPPRGEAAPLSSFPSAPLLVCS